MTIGSVGTTALSNQLSRELATKRSEGNTINSTRSDLPDFQNLVQDSNIAFKEEMDKKKATMGENGELRIGETKDDKSFREMLERVSGQPQRKTKNSLEKEDFLNLMVTQLKYQDPTKPADHQDMAAQLAQFNTVEQLVSANKSLDSMSKSQEELKSDKLTDYIGKEITAVGNSLHLGEGSVSTKGMFKLPAESAAVLVTIKNEKNETVKTIPLGSMKPGEHQISWDGTTTKGEKAPAGKYSFDISASTAEGKKLEVEKQVTTSVTGISQISKGGVLETPIGEFKAKEIVAIRVPGTAPNAAPAQATSEPVAKAEGAVQNAQQNQLKSADQPAPQSAAQTPALVKPQVEKPIVAANPAANERENNTSSSSQTAPAASSSSPKMASQSYRKTASQQQPRA